MRVLDDHSAGADRLRALGVARARLDILDADVHGNGATCKTARGAEAIVHLAGASGVTGSLAYPTGDAPVKVLGTLGVLEAARATGARVVSASTTAPLIGDTPAIDERTLPAPHVLNSADKPVAEAYLNPHAPAFGGELRRPPDQRLWPLSRTYANP